ncbi:MAG TPA: tetratricopeptide repeat protein [Gemmatimonadaceae bacterium]|jgi:predicted regulator of Ras-like GTPase activity (Roadblock/LC7/MglB family)
MVDDIRRWSDELARDPSSLVFLQLSEALRRHGQLEVAFKIALRGLERNLKNAEAHDLVARIAVDRRDFERAFSEWEIVLKLVPGHVGAMKGLGYLSFQQGRFDAAEQYLSKAAEKGAGSDVTNALETVRRSSGLAVAAPAPEERTVFQPPRALRQEDPQYLFADLLVDDAQTAMLLDANGLVLAGVYLDHDAHDISQNVGAQLSGISEEVRRSARHLDLGDWRAITFETHAAVVAMTPGVDNSVVVVAASRATALGLLRRLLDRCAERATDWLSRSGRLREEHES